MAMKTWKRLVLLAFFACAISGCGWRNHPKFHMPRLDSPGTALQQQHRAVQFDPFPRNDLGPEIVGGRPLSFIEPPNEVERMRSKPSWGNWRGFSQ